MGSELGKLRPERLACWDGDPKDLDMTCDLVHADWNHSPQPIISSAFQKKKTWEKVPQFANVPMAQWLFLFVLLGL